MPPIYITYGRITEGKRDSDTKKLRYLCWLSKGWRENHSIVSFPISIFLSLKILRFERMLVTIRCNSLLFCYVTRFL